MTEFGIVRGVGASSCSCWCLLVAVVLVLVLLLSFLVFRHGAAVFTSSTPTPRKIRSKTYLQGISPASPTRTKHDTLSDRSYTHHDLN